MAGLLLAAYVPKIDPTAVVKGEIVTICKREITQLIVQSCGEIVEAVKRARVSVTSFVV